LTKRTLYAKNSAAIVTHSGRHVKNIQYRHLLQTKKIRKISMETTETLLDTT